MSTMIFSMSWWSQGCSRCSSQEVQQLKRKATYINNPNTFQKVHVKTQFQIGHITFPDTSLTEGCTESFPLFLITDGIPCFTPHLGY